MSDYRIAEFTMLLAAVLLTACAGSEPQETTTKTQDSVYVGEEPLYAVLRARGDGQWAFGTVTRNNSEPDDGFLVRLNDLAPAFDTRPVECEPRAYRDRDRCSPANPFRDKEMGVVGKIVDTSINAGTGGTIKSVSRTYRTNFDQLGFNAAVDQALLTSGLDDGRVDFIHGLRRLQDMTDAHTAELSALTDRIISEYQQDRNESIRFDMRVAGLQQYYSHDLDPADFVTVTARSPTLSKSEAVSTDSDLLPCDAQNCIGLLHTALRQAELKHDARMSSLRAQLASQTDAYDVICDKSESAGYHFELTCPKQLKRSATGIVELPVQVEIHSRDFDHLFPEFSKQDDNLSASVQQGKLILENRTNDFVDIQSVSIYYNSHINTVPDDGGQFDLAPHQSLARPASLFTSPAIDIESRHANMTPDKARRASFSFGVAVKYSLRDRDSIETIYAVDDFRVHCAIENRLQPGSCSDGNDEKYASAGDE